MLIIINVIILINSILRLEYNIYEDDKIEIKSSSACVISEGKI